MKMKRNGYVYGLLVFLIFVSVFLVAITNMKSISVMQESNYDKITMMKISRTVRNIENVWPSFKTDLPPQARCVQFGKDLDGELPFEISVSCNPTGPMYLSVMSHSGRYNNTIILS